MFAVPQKIITQTILLASLIVPALAQADAQHCFNLLQAQAYADAKKEANQLLILLFSSKSSSDERDAQICLGRAYEGLGEYQDALWAFQRVEALSKTKQELMIACNWLGLIYGNLHELDKAESYDQRYLKLARELGDKRQEATALNNLAASADDRGDNERALKLYREVLSLRPEAEQAATLNNIAMIHSNRKEYKQAIEMMRRVIEIDNNAHASVHNRAIHKINLGAVLRNDKQYDAAEKELLAGLNDIRLVGDKHWEAIACEKLGWLANDNPRKTIDDVQQWMGKAEVLYSEIGDTGNAERIAKLLSGK